ncbi:hypothetical protein EVJ58_g1760 [Rhodofomes roseus]|uniref:Acyl-CoA oxidase n=1 Tax=Rhodofomes roseus TaxID=34475 RepID=A0A4Y9Z054_9APHY|nr:hypothetical protein EVJ58_g1760 [Rhodofomes roseus]
MLHDHPSFRERAELQRYDEQVGLVYQRTLAAILTWKLSLEDVETCSQRFWDMHKDPALVLDVGCANVLACHYNLFLGTVAPLVRRRKDLTPLVERALAGDIIGNFLLTEVGHGLDILNIETTATKVADGFVLNTPHPAAAKFMPPTTPLCPKIAVVFARLIVDNADHGIHPFLVHTSDAHGMCPGIVSQLLPPRSGTSPLDYAITSFHHVHLPPSAFLGASLDVPRDHHSLLQGYIWRTIVGQVSMSLVALTGMKMTAYLGVLYSLRRCVRGTGPSDVPIMSFRTQQLPLLYTTAIAHVLDAWTPAVLQQFTSADLATPIRRSLAIVYKTTMCRLATQYYREVGERLGAQGTFGHNIINKIEMDMRGFIVAEGDLTVLSISLYSQLLRNKYALPSPKHAVSLLARHSDAVYSRCADLLGSFTEGHRDEQFNNLVLPQCQRGVLALGCAYAYGCARDAGVPEPMLELFECAAIKQDPSWYSEHGGLPESVFMLKEDHAVHSALPHIREYVDSFGVEASITAPIVSSETWESWVEGLQTYDRIQEETNVSTGTAARNSEHSPSLGPKIEAEGHSLHPDFDVADLD